LNHLDEDGIKAATILTIHDFILLDLPFTDGLRR
jgi:hypothetical protein